MKTRFVDCRPREAYLSGHVPGAANADPELDLTGDDGGGRHPLPSAAAFAAWASAAGIDRDTLVVGYDEGTGWAARLWWLLRHFGHDAAGTIRLDAWNGPLMAGEEEIEPAAFVAEPRAGDTARRVRDPRTARRLVADARRREGAGALARRDGADRPGRGTHPRRPKPLLPRRVSAPEGAARCAGSRRLLRLGRHRLCRAPRAPPGGPRRRTALPRLVQRVVRARPGGTRLTRRRSRPAGARGAPRSRSAARGRARGRSRRARRAAAGGRRAAAAGRGGPR